MTLTTEQGEESQDIRREDSTVSTPDIHANFMLPSHGNNGPISSTPVPNRQLQNSSWDEDSMASPFDKMDADWKRMQLEDGYAESSSAPTPSLPSGYSLPPFNAADASYDVSTGTVDPPALFSAGLPTYTAPTPTRPAASLSREGTPRAKTKWNGVTDLRNTPLNAKFPRIPAADGETSRQPRLAPQTKLPSDMDDLSDSDDDVQLGMSPPVTINFTLPPRAQAVYNSGKTPVKSGSIGRLDKSSDGKKKDGEARMILDDLMEEMGSMDSPAMPTPEAFGRYSVVPAELGNGIRLFAEQVQIAGPSTTHGQSRTRKSMANTSYGSDIIDQPNQPTPAYDDSDSFDDDEDSFDSVNVDQQQTLGAFDQQHHHVMTDNSDGDITLSDTGGDTAVFGAGRPPAAGRPDSGASRFELMRQEEMQTWNGGRLEDAEPDLAASPTYAQGTRR